jgi:hypothetical protein
MITGIFPGELLTYGNYVQHSNENYEPQMDYPDRLDSLHDHDPGAGAAALRGGILDRG